MEKPKRRPKLFYEFLAKYIVEFIGTFLFVLSIGVNLGQDKPLTPLAIGCSLMAVVFLGGHISGSHYNPAVTIAIFLASPRSKISVAEAGKYAYFIVCQMTGATIGALIACGLNDASDISPAPGESYSLFQAFVAEFFFTFFLIIVVLNVTTKATYGNSYFGIAIGLTVFVGAVSVGDVSGAVFNPAVGTGLILANAMAKGGTLKYLWLYWISELLAACFASFVFRVTNAREYVEDVLHYDFSKEEKGVERDPNVGVDVALP